MRETATLQITFFGVCTHFRHVVPGVAHRVVLPDASALRFGFLDLPGHPQVSYFLMPHFAILRLPGRERSILQVETAMENGNIYDGVHLRIANAVGDTVNYSGEWDEINKLTTYMPHYAYSDEVVLNGRAACYVDLHSGTFTKVSLENGARAFQLTVNTDGPPALLATPFFAPKRLQQRITLATEIDASVDLHVGNLGMDCDGGEGNFDFLLHYLTAKGGIPRRLKVPTPGLLQNDRIQSPSQAQFDVALRQLQQLDYPNRFSHPPMVTESLTASGVGTSFFTSPACSDAGYP